MKKSTFNTIKKVVPKRGIIPAIDKAVLVDASGITATDLETWFQIALPDGWKVTGAGVVSLDILQNTAGAKSVQIDFETRAGVFTIDGRTFRSSVEPEYDFPEIPDTLNMLSDGVLIAKDVAGVLDFLDKNDLRPAMQGAYIGADIVGTNGHILRYIKSNYAGAPFILTRAGVELVKASLKDVETWKVKQDRYNVCLYAGAVQIIARKIDETYPNYSAVIPKDNAGLITLDKKQFQSTLKSLESVVNKNTKQVELKVIDAGAIEITGRDVDMNTESSQEIRANVSGIESAFRIGFNSKYLQTICTNIAGDSISMQLSQPNRAGVINDEILIMPVQLNDCEI
jgi:DNA polymerase-3 subunit beta